MQVRASIHAFLQAQQPNDLIAYLLAHPGLETQVNVSPGKDGRKTDRSGFTDGINNWWPIRIPKDASTEPYWNDYELKWPLELRANRIGSTGWDWEAKLSRYIVFDLDSIVAHAGSGVSPETLADARAAAERVPYVTIRRSTSGTGIHFYIHFAEPVPTANHNEHSALARAQLGQLSADAGFDFSASVDVCGGNTWLWTDTPSPNSFELLRQGEPLAKVVSNWRDHVPVVTRKASKVVSAAQSHEDVFESLASAANRFPLEPAHHDHMDYLAERGYTTAWDNDRHLLQTHTVGLKEVHDKFGLTGVYQTLSPGTDKSQPNCYLFPLPGGAWRVVRFGTPTEAPTWTIGARATSCVLNAPPPLRIAAHVSGGRDLPDGNFEFSTATEAAAAAKLLGQDIEIAPFLEHRRAVLKTTNDDRLAIEVKKEPTDPTPAGWSQFRTNIWAKVFDAPTEPPEDVTINTDNYRVLCDVNNKPCGYAAMGDGGWLEKSRSSMIDMLTAKLGSKTSASMVLGQLEGAPWKLDRTPFEVEYPGARVWNREAPQLAVSPLPRDAERIHPTWDLILNHAGQSANDAVRDASLGTIRTGGDYLAAWYAHIIRNPRCHLPFLFFFGPENVGKSTFWEAFRDHLVTGGCIAAEELLGNRDKFNDELDGAILCAIEERDTSKYGDAVYEKIKIYTTGKQLSLRGLYRTRRMATNYTHWCQCANSPRALKVLESTTRIVCFRVDRLTTEVPREELDIRLAAEAPAFLRTLLDMELPKPDGRLALPALKTDAAKLVVSAHNPAADFVARYCTVGPDERVILADLHAEYNAYLESVGHDPVNRKQMSIVFAEAGFDVTTGHKIRSQGSRVYAWGGLRLNQGEQSCA